MPIPMLIGLYLLRLYGKRLAVVLATLTALLLVFDMLAQSGDILEADGASVGSLAVYAVLRLPALLVLIAPFSVLIAALLTFNHLLATQEIVAMRAAGMSIYRICAILMLATGVLAAAQFWVANAVAPGTSERLRHWAAEDYEGKPPKAGSLVAPLWLAEEDAVIQIQTISTDGTRLEDVRIFQRDPQGILHRYAIVDEAVHRHGRWRVRGVNTLFTEDRDGGAQRAEPPSSAAAVRLLGPPESFAARIARPEEMGYEELQKRLEEPEESAHQPRVYRLWLHAKLAQPVGLLIMLLIAAPLALRPSRRPATLLVTFAAVAAGFAFPLLQQLLLTLGESGPLPAVLAAWMPAALFGTGCAWLLLMLEG